MKPEVVLVAALDRKRAIGKEGALPWRLRDDLKAFKELTVGSPVVMGRKTWESIGRPLPGRQNVVLSRSGTFSAPGADVVTSPEAALKIVEDAPTLFIIGGGAIYKAFLPLADQLVLTRVDTEVEGADAWVPEWDTEAFDVKETRCFPADERNDHAFVIETHASTGSHR